MRYQVRALREPEGVVSLLVEASDDADALRQAREHGYMALGARRVRGWSLRRSARFPLVLFTQELLALLSAGLTVVEAFETLAEKEHRPETRKLMQTVIQRLREGYPLSSALEQFPHAFPPLYVASVRASERTGDLAEALGRYIAYQTQMDHARRKLVSASIYPVMLLVVGGGVTAFLLVYVVPKFSRIYAEMGTDLPFLSQLLLSWGRLLETHGAVVFVAFLLFAVGAAYALTRRWLYVWLTRRLSAVPAIAKRLQIYQLARFYRTLGMLLRGGTPVMTALPMVSGLLLADWRARLAGAQADIRAGQLISRAMDAHALTTPVSARMLRVGERSGKMAEMMERIAGFYDDEIARWTDWFTRLIEPILMVIIGVVIGTIVVLMYFPIFELAGNLQ